MPAPAAGPIDQSEPAAESPGQWRGRQAEDQADGQDKDERRDIGGWQHPLSMASVAEVRQACSRP